MGVITQRWFLLPLMGRKIMSLQETSYGIIPLKKDKENILVFLVLLKSGHHWGFPKGHQQNSEEEPLDVARRELLEETSLQIDYIIEKVPFLLEEYVYEKLDQKVQKKVGYFIAFVKGLVKLQEEEIEDGKWFTFDDAYKTLTYPQSQEILYRVKDYI